MKCNSCGAIGAAYTTKCEFCGAEFTSIGMASPVSVAANQVAGPQISFAKDSLNLIGELNSTPPSGFSWWAFFFPIAYLFGYGAHENGKKVAVVMLIPALILSLLMYLSMRLAGLASVLDYIWILFVAYLVATRTHALVIKGEKFNLGKGIGAQLVYAVLIIVIMDL